MSMFETLLSVKSWSSETVGEFLRSVEYYPDCDRGRYTVDVAREILARGGDGNVHSAAVISEYALNNCGKMPTETKAVLYSILASINEKELSDYAEAYRLSLLWKELSSGVVGADVSLVRNILMRDRFAYSEALRRHLNDSYGDFDLGYRTDRLYEALAEYVIALNDGDEAKTVRQRKRINGIITADETILPDFFLKPDATPERLNVPTFVREYAHDAASKLNYTMPDIFHAKHKA